jgi:hypothetical protein
MLTSGAILWIVCLLLWNKHRPDDGEAFWSEYLNEVENLKRDRYWSSRVADFLPLALAKEMCDDMYEQRELTYHKGTLLASQTNEIIIEIIQ